jgi:hypothetical protein
MKVFISSVTALLKEERNALPAFLQVADHEPLRFEDFTAQDRSSREACLAGVDAADVYLLLLGPKYGDPRLPSQVGAEVGQQVEGDITTQDVNAAGLPPWPVA